MELWSESLKGRDVSEHLSIDGRIILKWILMKKYGGCEREVCDSG